MKRLMKKTITILLVVMALISTFMVNSFAAYENTYKNTGNQRVDIVGVAKTQIGNTNAGHRYRNDNLAWCASFVVWCARQANIDSSIIKNSGYADADDLGVTYRGRSADRSSGINYTPQSGDLIFFDWYSQKDIEKNEDGIRDGYCNKTPASSYGDHVGIVESVSGGTVTTIEGNSNNQVRRRTYSLSDSEIKGYGVPNYKNNQHKSYYWLDLNCYLDGSYRGNISGIATADVYINNKLVANDVTDYYTQHPTGTKYKITDIRMKSGYKNNGNASYSGTINGNVNVNLSFAKVKSITYFNVNFRMKSGVYTNAYSSYTCATKVGRVYPGDVIRLQKVYSNGVAQLVCPWSDSSGSYNRTVYCKISELKFKATKYIQAYSGVNGSTCGRVYPNDVVTVCEIYSSGWMKAICPWTGGVNKTIYLKCSSIY